MTHVIVSVVIPALNEEEYIASAIASIAVQHYPLNLIEAIVVDNGSSDRTVAVARAATVGRAELRVSILQEPERGVSRAKNRGAAAASGQLLLFLDGDSRLEPDLIARVVAEYQSGATAGTMRIAADSSHPIELGFFALLEVGKRLFKVRGMMLFCDRATFLALGGFDSALNLGEDTDLLRRLERRSGSSTRIVHVRDSAILTSPRRLRTHPYHLAIFAMFGRWLLAAVGLGRQRPY
jgi:glycosyltransferase involved in cell wall biosynthesis